MSRSWSRTSGASETSEALSSLRQLPLKGLVGADARYFLHDYYGEAGYFFEKKYPRERKTSTERLLPMYLPVLVAERSW